jgi:hypothetical protein
LLSRVKGFSLVDWMRIGRVNNVSISELIQTEAAWEAIRIAEVVEEIRQLNASHEPGIV